MMCPKKPPYLRIATEEAFATQEQLAEYRKILNRADCDNGFKNLMGFYMTSPSERAQHIMRCLVDLDEIRIAHMNESGIDMQVLGLTSPGVQIMDKGAAVAIAKSSNDELAAAIAKHPTRLAGMIAIAPQDPEAAAKELQRGVNQLGMNAAVINSHTQGEYLSDPKFWPIFEAAQSLDTPIYLHPNALPPKMIEPFIEAGLDGAIYGFGVETGLHALRLITAGVFDHFPKLQIIIGHMGEALPFWMYRLDYMHAATVKSKRYASIGPTKKKPSDYLRENFVISNSGVAWDKAIRFSQEVLGVDRVMYAMDYPYQYTPSEVTDLDAMAMSDADKFAFFQGNAQRVFKLKTGG